jgi:GNAT superfamily N-acetyltransferase
MNDPLSYVEVDDRRFIVGKTWGSHRAVTISWAGKGLDRGCAEAEQLPGLPEEWWWVNRVLVQPPQCRSAGIGSELIRQISIAAHDLGCKHLVVCPGGYSQTPRDKKRQIAFYERNGFVWRDDVPFSHDATKAMVLDLGG